MSQVANNIKGIIIVFNTLVLLAGGCFGIYLAFIWKPSIDVNVFMSFANILLAMEGSILFCLLYFVLNMFRKQRLPRKIVITDIIILIPALIYFLYIANAGARDFFIMLLRYFYPM